MKFRFFFVALIAVLLFSGCTQQSPGNQPLQQGNGSEMPFGGNPNGPEQQGFDKNQQPNQLPPQNQPQQKPEFVLPYIDSNIPLPILPDNVPKGAWVSKKLGAVEMQYFSTAIVRGMSESGTDFFISLKNTGSAKAKLCIPALNAFTEGVGTLRKYIPSWNTHFFAMQNSPIEIEPGQEKKLWYFASIDSQGYKDNNFFTVPFKIDDCGTTANSVELPVTFGFTAEDFSGKETSYIYGTIKDEDGNPVSQASIMASMNCGRLSFRGIADPQGAYFIKVLGMEDINAIYADRRPECDSTDYFVSAEQQGFEYYYYGRVAPAREQPAKLDIVLKEKKTSTNYSLEWEKKIVDNYGFFWITPSYDWSVFAAAQAKHPPMLNKPTNFYLFDAKGNILWKQPTQNECWGLDIAKDGSKVVAGCTDGLIYLVDKTGKLLWTYDNRSMVRNACFSNDGTKVLSGSNPMLLDSKTGAKQDLPWNVMSGLRNCAFYKDDSGFIAGARDMTGFDAQGNLKWLNVVGEFPLFLAVDGQNNVFAAGKSRMLFSFDSAGNLRWKHKIPDLVITEGAISSDGNRIVVGTVGGMVYLFDNEGNLLWKRDSLEMGTGGFVGHNAVAISEDGKTIVVGTAWQAPYCVVAYNETGTIIWKNCSEPDETNKDLLLGVTNVQISPDKKQIIAAYGDNYIRKFTLNG